MSDAVNTQEPQPQGRPATAIGIMVVLIALLVGVYFMLRSVGIVPDPPEPTPPPASDVQPGAPGPDNRETTLPPAAPDEAPATPETSQTNDPVPP